MALMVKMMTAMSLMFMTATALIIINHITLVAMATGLRSRRHDGRGGGRRGHCNSRTSYNQQSSSS